MASARLGSARLGSARLGSARLGSARLGSARLRIAASKRALDVKSFCESFINFSLSVPFRPGHRGGQQQHTRTSRSSRWW